MHPYISKTLSILAIALVSVSCCHTKKYTKTAETKAPGPHAIIYQTRVDYSNLVPINLSDDKKSIESYPDVKDVFYQGNLATPTPLHKGWLLDNRGISKNVAFIKLTYEQYSKLEKTPSVDELTAIIVDKNPVTRMYDLGLRSDFQDIENELNKRIDDGTISDFKILK